MEPQPPSREEPSGWWARPEPHMPPGLNREQAWAWALDNFPALSRRSCQCSHFCRYGNYGARGWLRHASPGHGVPGVQAETAMELQSPRREADATGSAAHWGLKQPGDARASGGGQTHDQMPSRSPGRPRKLLKTKA